MFEDNDDIQAIWHNWENEDDYEGWYYGAEKFRT